MRVHIDKILSIFLITYAHINEFLRLSLNKKLETDDTKISSNN